jgi:hypothetical protein
MDGALHGSQQMIIPRMFGFFGGIENRRRSLARWKGTALQAAEKVRKADFRGLKPARNNKNKRLLPAQLKLRSFQTSSNASFSAACLAGPKSSDSKTALAPDSPWLKPPLVAYVWPG